MMFCSRRLALLGAGASILASVFLGSAALAQTSGQQALVRFPTLHGGSIVFEAGGNLWKVGLAGGEARRLTADPGYDQMPRFSPNGKWIAFTGEYAGQTDVYVMPAAGGQVKRLTFDSDVTPHAPMRWGPNNMVVTWTPDSKKVVFLSRRDTYNSWFGRLFEVPVGGGLPTAMPLPKGGMLSFNADGTKIAYNRIFRNFRTWKHYYGGLAQDVWVYDFKSKKVDRITHWKGSDIDPMWYGDTIYYASDQGPDHTMNLWAYSLKTRQFRQVTHFKNYDIDWPSLGNTGIAFADQGKLYVLKLPSEKLVEVPVTVPNDGVRSRPYWYDASQMIRSADIAPNGKLAVFGARGDIFTVPAKHGDTNDITRTTGAREQYPSWSPDGKTVAYVTDASGQSEIAMRPATGGKETLLTSTEDRSYYGPTWSPNGQWLAFSDSSKTLWLLNVSSRKVYKVAHDKWNEMKDFSFSPDSGWLAYSETQPNGMRALFIYGVNSHSTHQVTNSWFDNSNPVFSSNGKYLYFVSARHQNPAFSSNEFNVANMKPDGLYVTTLEAGTPSPFAPREASATENGKNGGNGKGKSTVHVKIDFDGLAQRAVPLPVATANIDSVAESNGVVFYTTSPNPILGNTLPGEAPALMAYDMNKRKGKQLVAGVSGFALSDNGKSLLYQAGNNWYIRAADMSDGSGDKLDLSHMQMRVDPVAEWKEMYWQAWRLEHNFFVNPKMNGKDWKAIGKRYAALLPLVTCRQDLNYLIGEMIGSLQNSHTYVGGGYSPDMPKYMGTGMLGANFALDAKSGRYYFSRIYRGDNTLDGYTAPLDQPGLKVAKGDYVLAINGQDLRAPENPYRFLVNTLGTTVTLKLADNAAGRNAWTIRVKPIKNALPLWLHAWIKHNREEVTRLSGGKIGYIYLSDMEVLGMDQFMRQFYPQLMKQGLIIDDRYNGGGFIDPIVLERLKRKLVSLFGSRQDGPRPQNAIALGYKAVLINHYSASDGDIFPWKFKQMGLGPAIGERTWGGVRGIRGYWPLMDGGYITIPEESMYDTKSAWIVENVGVEPDIKVDNPPGAVMSGKDPQLQTAVQVLMKKIKAHPVKLPAQPSWLPAYPPQPNYPPCPAQTTCGGNVN
ncbi:MAG TPA: S41 family peptidase [Gammaproteobacteria bacterium]|nr:S41 family peptidase [Gammaproteobacteria bacterium]